MRQFLVHMSARFYPRGKMGLRVLAAAIILAPAAFPQFMGQGGMPTMMGGVGNGENGFGFYGVSAFAAYTSRLVPFNASLPTPGLDFGPNYIAGGSASAGWQSRGPRTDAHLTYTFGYDASLRHSSFNAMSHFLNFGVTHEISARLSFAFAGTAAIMRWDQSLFGPSALGELVQTPATFDELTSAILAGKYTNTQLASILTGAPILNSPANSLLFGPRFFTSTVRSSLSYAKSERLRFGVGVSGTRTERLKTGQAGFDGSFLIPSVTMVGANVNVSYLVTPVTTIGFTAGATRTFSRFSDAYAPTAVITADRAFGRHWLVDGRAGAGTYFSLRQTLHQRSTANWIAGGSLTYKTYTETFSLQYSHTITDIYGLGAQYTDSGGAEWVWHLPGKQWAVFAGARYEQLWHSAFGNVHAWVGTAGMERRLGSHTTAMAGTFYGKNSGVAPGGLATGQLLGAELVVSWTPQAMGM